MSDPLAFGVNGAGWLRLAFGLAVFLAPGVAAADRIWPGSPLRFVLAPVLSFTLLPLAAIVLGFGLGVPVTPAATLAIALGLAAAFGARRIRSWLPRSRAA